MNAPRPLAARLAAKHLDPEYDPYGRDAFSFPGGGSGVGYATRTPECFKHPATVEVVRLPGTDEDRLADIAALVKRYEGRRFQWASLEIEDIKWLLERARAASTAETTGATEPAGERGTP